MNSALRVAEAHHLAEVHTEAAVAAGVPEGGLPEETALGDPAPLLRRRQLPLSMLHSPFVFTRDIWRLMI